MVAVVDQVQELVLTEIMAQLRLRVQHLLVVQPAEQGELQRPERVMEAMLQRQVAVAVARYRLQMYNATVVLVEPGEFFSLTQQLPLRALLPQQRRVSERQQQHLMEM